MEASIIIPMFNAEKTIESCLKNVLNQKSKAAFEVIVVDDGSADRSRELVEKFKEVTLLKQEHKGPAAARNLGAKKAKGGIVMFTDSDCLADQSMVEELAKPFKQNKEIAGVQGSYTSSQKELMARFSQLEIEQRYARMSKTDFIDFIGSYCCAYRKDIFLEAGGFDESFPAASGEDPELSYRLSRQGFKLVFNPKAMVWHTHHQSLQKYLKMKFFRAFWRIPLYRKHKTKMVKDSYTPQELKIQVASMVVLLFSIPGLAFPSIIFLQFLALAGALIFLLASLPFVFFCLKRDFHVGMLSPALLFLRTLAFLGGLVSGFVKGVIYG